MDLVYPDSLKTSKFEMVSILMDLVSIPSSSYDSSGIENLIMYLNDLFKPLYAKVSFLPSEKEKRHIKFVWEGKEPQLLILCHLDTVWNENDFKFMPVKEAKDWLFGPGCYDMKSGIIITFFALKEVFKLKKKLPNKITLLINSDEEIGSIASREYIEKEARNSKLCFVMEPAFEDGSIKIARKGTGRYHIKIKGKKAHSGADKDKGISAVLELAHQIIKLESMQNKERGISVNVGKIQGGTRSNIVPDFAEAWVDLRIRFFEDIEKINNEILSLTPFINGTSIEISGGLNRPPMVFDKNIKKAFEWAKGISNKIGIELIGSESGGASDGNFVANLGIPVLDGLGAIGSGAHSYDEKIYIPSLPERTALLASLILNLDSFPV